MPIKVNLDDGSETDAFTPEEVEAQKQAAIEEFKQANPDKSDELAKAQEELAKFKDKDLNFGLLRKQKEEAEKKVEDILKGVDEKVSTVEKRVLEGVMKDHYGDSIKRLVGDDKELRDKLEFQYKRLGDPAGTKAEVDKKLNDAFLLATGGGGGVSSKPFSSGGASFAKPKENTLTDDDKDLLRKMGKGHLAK